MNQEPAVALGPRNGEQPLAGGSRLDRFDVGARKPLITRSPPGRSAAA